MKTVALSPRDYIKWFTKNNKIDGHEINRIQTNTGREIRFDDMTDEDAEFVASQFMLMMAKPEGSA
jgi:hypothetical protein